MARHDGGWVKIYRKLTSPNSDIGSNGYRLAILTTLVAWANRDETTIQWNGKPRKIGRGQVVIGVRDLAEHLKFSKDTVFRQIQYLSLRDTICKETATEGTLITINKYEEYQDIPEVLRQDCDTVATLAGHDSGRQPNAPSPPNGEVKKRRIYKAKTPTGAIEEFSSPSLVQRLVDVSQESQRLWIETYSDVEWLRRKMLQCADYFAKPGAREVKDWRATFARWFNNADDKPPGKLQNPTIKKEYQEPQLDQELADQAMQQRLAIVREKFPEEAAS